eukprot:m.112089 g.112089  ORF g.112089 m.112089 type:complete len:167 (+) comp9246_c2_seq2:29-529(+)
MTTLDPDRYKVGEKTINTDLEALKILSEDSTCATFVIANEDHTLGNSLKWVLNKDPRVEFCGYSVPHPSDKLINLRVQVKQDEGETAVSVLKDALRNLMRLCDFMSEQVEKNSTEFRQANGLEIPPFHVDPIQEAMDKQEDAGENEEDDEEDDEVIDDEMKVADAE